METLFRTSSLNKKLSEDDTANGQKINLFLGGSLNALTLEEKTRLKDIIRNHCDEMISFIDKTIEISKELYNPTK